MPEMLSLAEHQYGGRALSKGDLFHVEQNHVMTLVALGRAQLAGDSDRIRDVAAAAPAEYQTRDMVAAPIKRGRGRPRKIV
jgi:hypothetical protein